MKSLDAPPYGAAEVLRAGYIQPDDRVPQRRNRDDFQIFPSQDDSYIALQGRVGRETVNVRVLSTAIDGEAEGTPSKEQRVRFVRHNLSAFGAIAQAPSITQYGSDGKRCEFLVSHRFCVVRKRPTTAAMSSDFPAPKQEPFLEPRASLTWNRMRTTVKKLQENHWSG